MLMPGWRLYSLNMLVLIVATTAAHEFSVGYIFAVAVTSALTSVLSWSACYHDTQSALNTAETTHKFD